VDVDEDYEFKEISTLTVHTRTNALSGPGWLETRGLAQSALNPDFET